MELWFAKIERGIFILVKNLGRKLMRYIKHYTESATPVKRKYAVLSKRLSA